MPTEKLNGTEVYYEISGNGPPLLLLAGMMSDSASWLPLLPLLEPHFTVIRPDNRATGRMQDATPFVLPDCADDHAALVEHLGLSDLHVAGHSMGGYLALMLSERVPERLASLSLLASAAVNGHRNFLLFQHALKLRGHPEPDFWLRNLYPWLMSPGFFANREAFDAHMAAALAYPHAQTRDSMTLQLGALTGHNGKPPKSLPCKAQALLAEHDLLFPLADARKALSAIPDLVIHEVEGAGHSIHWENPAEVARLLRAFAT